MLQKIDEQPGLELQVELQSPCTPICEVYCQRICPLLRVELLERRDRQSQRLKSNGYVGKFRSGHCPVERNANVRKVEAEPGILKEIKRIVREESSVAWKAFEKRCWINQGIASINRR